MVILGVDKKMKKLHFCLDNVARIRYNGPTN